MLVLCLDGTRRVYTAKWGEKKCSGWVIFDLVLDSSYKHQWAYSSSHLFPSGKKNWICFQICMPTSSFKFQVCSVFFKAMEQRWAPLESQQTLETNTEGWRWEAKGGSDSGHGDSGVSASKPELPVRPQHCWSCLRAKINYSEVAALSRHHT